MHMEIIISIGLGLWFALAGLVATVAVCRTLSKDKEDKE